MKNVKVLMISVYLATDFYAISENVVTIQSSITEHANLLNDMAPVSRCTQCLQIVKKCLSHLQYAAGHGGNIIPPKKK